MSLKFGINFVLCCITYEQRIGCNDGTGTVLGVGQGCEEQTRPKVETDNRLSIEIRCLISDLSQHSRVKIIIEC